MCHCVCVTMEQVYSVSLCTYHKPATPFFKCKVQLSNILISTNLYPVPVVKENDEHQLNEGSEHLLYRKGTVKYLKNWTKVYS